LITVNSKHFVLMVLSTFVLLGVTCPVAADDRPNIEYPYIGGVPKWPGEKTIEPYER